MADFEHWRIHAPKKARKIDQLISDIEVTPYKGLGKPKALRGELAGWWARRIDRQHRLVYRIQDEDTLIILQCRFHD